MAVSNFNVCILYFSLKSCFYKLKEIIKFFLVWRIFKCVFFVQFLELALDDCTSII